MSSQPSKFYLTTPIYYVNARPHIGHAYTTIVADVLARRHRLLGEDTMFLTGTDEHGQKIERSAAAAGIPPQQFADQVSQEFRRLWDRMGITYDDYIRTTESRHHAAAQKLFRELYERGHIYLSSYTGAYCVSDETFVDAPAGTPCPDCGRLLETVTEENFFFRLSAFQQPLIERIEAGTLKIENEARRNEVLSFVRGGLKDLSVSRSSFTWGIPVPDDVQQKAGATGKHVIYVWLDALTNYMTAVGYGSGSEEDKARFERYWPADLHLVGKEIIRFHCVYWPAFLMAAELPLPKAITAHGWLLFDNSKMSKSKGNIVRTETILEAFGEHVYAKQFPESTKPERDLFAADVLRYFLLREIPFGQDGSFSFEALWGRYDAELGSKYGNSVKRVLTMLHEGSGGLIPELNSVYKDWSSGESAYLLGSIAVSPERVRLIEKHFDFADFAGFTSSIMNLIGWVNDLLANHKPWKDESIERFNRELVLYTAAESIRIITALLYPILPYATAKVWQQLGLGDIELAAKNGELRNLQWGGLKPGTKLGALGPVFPRADKSLIQVMTDMEDQKTTTRPDALISAASTPAPSAPVPAHSTDPGAPPRALDEPAGTLPVAGSTAHTTGPDNTPSHMGAPASGIFAATSAQPEAPATNVSPQITIDDFVKIDLRVAQIVVAERIPKADKLLRLEVDLGYEKRQILSGIAEWYTPESLIGRRIAVIANLAPRKMRGLESHGMLLAASEGDGGKPILATFGEEVALGSRIK